MTITTTTIPVPTITGAVDRTGRAGVRHVGAALRSEWLKLSTLRTNKVMVLLAGLVGSVIAWGLAATATDPSLTASELFIYPLPLVATMAIVTGILMFTGEVQHGTLAVTLAARPARWVVAVAKTAMAAFAGVVLGVTGMVAGFAGAALGGVDLGNGTALVSRSAWALLYVALAAVLGLGVGMIARHSAGAISGLLMWAFVIENLFAPALPEGVLHALPFSAGYRLLDAGRNFEAPVVIADELSRPMYALIFGGYALVSLAIGTFLLTRRDTN